MSEEITKSRFSSKDMRRHAKHLIMVRGKLEQHSRGKAPQTELNSIWELLELFDWFFPLIDFLFNILIRQSPDMDRQWWLIDRSFDPMFVSCGWVLLSNIISRKLISEFPWVGQVTTAPYYSPPAFLPRMINNIVEHLLCCSYLVLTIVINGHTSHNIHSNIPDRHGSMWTSV